MKKALGLAAAAIIAVVGLSACTSTPDSPAAAPEPTSGSDLVVL